MTSLHRFIPIIVATAVALVASGCTLVTESRIGDGARTERSYRSVAGSVHIGRDAVIHTARTVAGAIYVGDGATTRSLSSVAGEIRIGKNVQVDGDVSTVAGSIHIDDGTHVSGSVTSTAGGVALNGCEVNGLVRIKKGSLRTHGAVRLPRGLQVHYAHADDNDRVVRVDIGAGADVASIEVEPDTDVELRISRAATVGKITGAAATYY